MEHDWVWAYIVTITSIGLAIYIFMNHLLNVWGIIAVLVMMLCSVFMAQMYASLLNEYNKKTLEDAMKIGLTELGEDTSKFK